MERQSELRELETEFKNSIRAYRQLVRTGMDEAMEVPGEVAQQLIARTREQLDRSDSMNARAALSKLGKHIDTMKSAFPKVKSHFNQEFDATIHFLERRINERHLAGKTTTRLHHEVTQLLERLRFAVQNDDWQNSRHIKAAVIEHYISGHQSKIRQLPRSIPDASTAIQELVTHGAQCRSVMQSDVEKLFSLSAQRRSNALGIGVVASQQIIEILFSELSKSRLILKNPKRDGDQACALIRLGLDRNSFVYIIGIAVEAASDISSLDSISEHLDSIIIKSSDDKIPRTTYERFLITALEKIPQRNVSLGGNMVYSFTPNCGQFEAELTAKTFTDWLGSYLRNQIN